jgi:hypothetical protein
VKARHVVARTWSRREAFSVLEQTRAYAAEGMVFISR